MKFPLAMVGIIVGGLLLKVPGVIIGLVIGLLAGELFDLKKQVMRLEAGGGDSKPRELRVAEATERHAVAVYSDTGHVKEELLELPVEEIVDREAEDNPILEPIKEPIAQHVHAENETSASHDSAAREETYQTDGVAFERVTDYIRTFFTTGNVVVKVGVIILFFGVSFLLKYAAERNAFPVEFRLSAVAAGAMGMLILGWRLRFQRTKYALVLQGGSIGILYITVFAAAKLYGLLPVFLVFPLMVALVGLCSGLAVMQDSRALAAFGISGGFLAPVLASTGGGSHVLLFSYYALLNAGIFGIAWFKAWRILNVLGFLFTFVIGAAWGNQYYRPEFFASTEPFLVLFFLFYVFIPVLFAHRQPPQLKGYVDSSLVFGVPLVGFALQAALVRNFEYGMAISALSLSAFYIILATSLWRRQLEGMRLLTEVFLALGVVFGSIAIPLALTGKWTAVSWSLEGAALVWIGIRQQRLLARLFGLLLQVGAGISFLSSHETVAGNIPVLNGIYLVCFIISLAGLFTSFYLERHHENLREWEKKFYWPALVWGLLWWFGGGLDEIQRQLPGRDEINASLLFIGVSCLLFSLFSKRLSWHGLRYPLILFLPVMLFTVPIVYASHGQHPFFRWGVAAWGIAFGIQYILLRVFEEDWPQGIVRMWQVGTFWLGMLILAWEASWGMNRFISGSATWRFLPWGVVPGAVVFGLLSWGKKIKWPVRKYWQEYEEIVLPFLVTGVWIWCFAASFMSGDPAPLLYFPILNPVDITQIFTLLVMGKWAWEARQSQVAQRIGAPQELINSALALIVFIWLNAIVARTVHYWGGISLNPDALLHSAVYQATVSILWSLVALSAMVAASIKRRRTVWIVGVTLIGLVVLKLFIVDLSSTGTVGRIISFIAVGVLMLVVGYFSPLPPHRPEEVKA